MVDDHRGLVGADLPRARPHRREAVPQGQHLLGRADDRGAAPAAPAHVLDELVERLAEDLDRHEVGARPAQGGGAVLAPAVLGEDAEQLGAGQPGAAEALDLHGGQHRAHGVAPAHLEGGLAVLRGQRPDRRGAPAPQRHGGRAQLTVTTGEPAGVAPSASIAHLAGDALGLGDEGLDDLVLGHGLDDLALDEDLPLAVAGGDAQVGLAGLAGAVDDAAHDGHAQRHGQVLQAGGDGVGELVDVHLGAAAGRAGDDLELARAQVERLAGSGCRP